MANTKTQLKRKYHTVYQTTNLINNGIDNLRISKIDLDSYIADGWKKGMITTRWSNF